MVLWRDDIKRQGPRYARLAACDRNPGQQARLMIVLAKDIRKILPTGFSVDGAKPFNYPKYPTEPRRVDF